jgi:hypothetical protein
LQQSSSLAYDDTTKSFSIVANQNSATALSLSNNSTGSSAVITSTLFSSNAVGNSILYGSGRVNDNVNQYQTGASYIIDYQGPIGLNLASTFASGTNSGIRFWTAAGTNNGVERLRITSGGNVLINTTTDAGFKLDVNGTARMRTSSGSYVSPLTVENTGSASVDFKNVAIFIGARGNASNIDDNTNIGIWQKSNIVNNYATMNFFNSLGNLSAYVGTQFLNHGASPTGNLIFGTVLSGTPTTRMTIKSTGVINFSSLPTSPTGLSSGDVWNNLGILTIV